jgi:hypothetical protein
MPRSCAVCTDPERSRIDEELVAGKPFRAISCNARMSRESIRRHAAAHLPAKLVKAEGARALASAETLAEKLKGLELEARRLGQKAEKSGDLRVALQAVREMTRLWELAGRLTGEFQQQAAVQINLVGLDPQVRAFVEDRGARDFLVACSRIHAMSEEEMRQLVDGPRHG